MWRRSDSQLRLLAVVLFFFGILLIVPSGFRGDVGPDSADYRMIFDSAVSAAQLEIPFNGTEPFFQILLFASSSIFENYESFQIMGMIYSLLVFTFIFIKTPNRNFIVFFGFYVAFLYYQLQWSTIRAMFSFWTLSLLLLIFRSTFFPFIVASLFHFSSIIGLFAFTFRKISYAAIALVVLVLSVMYLERYATYYGTSFIIEELLFGGMYRFIYHLLLLVALTSSVGFVPFWKRDREKIRGVFFSILPVCLLTPIGWRILAIFLPIVLVLNFRYLDRIRLYLFISICYFVFLQKSYTFFLREGSPVAGTVLEFLVRFYVSPAIL